MNSASFNAAGSSNAGYLDHKPVSTIEMLSKEQILEEWRAAVDSLAQRDKEMMQMSNDFEELIQSTQQDMDELLHANQTMMEESRRRGLHLKKLEVFFAEFPLPYSLRMPIATAFSSVGIDMPWWCQKVEKQQKMPTFSDFDVPDSDELCSDLRDVVEIKDRLAERLVEEQARHEAEMETFKLHHVKSIAVARQNAMLKTAEWTVTKLKLQSRIQEKEAEVKSLKQQLYLLKKGMEGMQGRNSNPSSHSQILEHLSQKTEYNKILESDSLTAIGGDYASSSSRRPKTSTVPLPPFDVCDAASFSCKESVFQTFESRAQMQDEVKNASPGDAARMSVIVRGLKGTKICGDFRLHRAAGSQSPISNHEKQPQNIQNVEPSSKMRSQSSRKKT
jgi:hypothetical protein